jgi:hypothetical protein
MRALRLLTAILALSAVILLANRWHASRALDSACARSAALGLRLDQTRLAHERAPEARAALLAAHDACNAIGERALERYEAESAPDEYSEERLDALTRDESHRDAAALESAAIRFLAAGVLERPGEILRRELSTAADGTPEARVNPSSVRHSLVDCLSGAARVAVAQGAHAQGWRWIELAAEVCATQRGTDTLGVSFIQPMLRALRVAYQEAAVTAPDDPARERVRLALRDLDILHEARAALRNEASVFLSMVDELTALGDTHGLSGRLLAIALRDKAMLHRTWADTVEASELASTADQRAALAAVDARMDSLPRTYALTLLTVRRALPFWEHALATEADRNTLLAE